MPNVLLSNTAEGTNSKLVLRKSPAYAVKILAVSLLRGALKRLNHIKKADATWKEDILATYPKSVTNYVVDKFNAIFEGIERERLVNEVLQQTGQKTAYNS
jgi:hypothetical protein